MKFSSITFLCILTVTPVVSFTNPSLNTRQTTSLQAERNHNKNSNINNVFSNCYAIAAMSALLWGSPTMLAEQASTHQYQFPFGLNDVIEHNVMANAGGGAQDKASATGSRVNKDPESLLRLGLPINNKQVRELQGNIETIKGDVSSKRKSSAYDEMKKVKSIVGSKKKVAKMVASCRSPEICTQAIQEIDAAMDPLAEAIKSSQDALKGSLEESEALDKAFNAQQKAAGLLSALEEQMIPEGYSTPVPSAYSDLPQLKQRATVEMVLKKGADGDKFDINGVNFPEAKLVMVIDGYAAPVTGGNFIDLVNKGFYNNMKIQRSDGFVVQTGEPDGEAVGYTGGKPSKSIGQGPKGERLIPSEIFIKGDKSPIYEIDIEEEGRGGEATVLPFSAYGVMGWAREEYDPNSGSSQFFWLLFDSDLTPAGKNVLDGRYPCFGYVIEGSDFLQDVKEGDVIVSAKVTKGLEYLKDPQ